MKQCKLRDWYNKKATGNGHGRPYTIEQQGCTSQARRYMQTRLIILGLIESHLSPCGMSEASEPAPDRG